MSNPWHLALDYGTITTVAAHTTGPTGAIATLLVTPSATYVSEDGTIITGDAAHTNRQNHPARFIPYPKRYIEHEFVPVAGATMPLATIIGATFRTALDAGRAQHAGHPPTTVTITHPEPWTIPEVMTLVEAASTSGINRDTIRIISEPRAAAIHSASGPQIAICDFGGGTLDITTLQAEPAGDVRVTAATGDSSLGGLTIDNLLYQWFISRLERDHPHLAAELHAAPPQIMRAVEQSIHNAKEQLSTDTETTITIAIRRHRHDIHLTRTEFEHIIASVIGRVADLARPLLNLGTPLYLTGGSALIPCLRTRLEKIASVTLVDDPSTAVAHGAIAATQLGLTTPIRDLHHRRRHSGTEAFPAVKPATPLEPAEAEAGAKAEVKEPAADPATAPAEPVDPPTPPEPAAPTKSKPKKRRYLLTTILTLICVGALAAAGYFIITQKKPDNTADPAPAAATSKPATTSTLASAGATTTQPTTSPHPTVSKVAAVNTENGDAEIPLIERYNTANQFLPEKFVNASQKCTGKADEHDKYMPVPVYKCTLAEDPDAPKLDHDVSVGNYYWVPGEHAKAARDELESGRSTLASDLNTLTRMHIQKADGAKPEIGAAFPKSDWGYIYVYYPKDNFTMYFWRNGIPTREQVDAYLKYMDITQ